MLTITDRVFVLTIREKKESIELRHSSDLAFILSAALLIELWLNGFIVLDEENRVLDKQNVPEEKRLASALSMIKDSPKPRKIGHWVRLFSSKDERLEKSLLKKMMRRGVIIEKGSTFRWVVPNPETGQSHSIKFACKQELREIAFSSAEADVDSAAVFMILKSFHMLPYIFTADEIKTAAFRVDEILDDLFAQSELRTGLETILQVSTENVRLSRQMV